MAVAGDMDLGVSSKEKLTQQEKKRAQHRLWVLDIQPIGRCSLDLNLQPFQTLPQTFPNRVRLLLKLPVSSLAGVLLVVVGCLVGWLAFLT